MQFTNKSFQDKVRERLLEVFKKGGDIDLELDKTVSDPTSKSSAIWAANDLAKEGWVVEAVKVAKHYQFDPDPAEGDKDDKDILGGEEIRWIGTVRGTLCWLLLTIAGKLETAYYPDILDMLEGKESDTDSEKALRLATGKHLYVRQQATYPLENLAANMRAVRNADGSKFDFGEKNRERTEALIFRMLEENKNYPRILEALAKVFNRMRYLDEAKAYYVLETFFYKAGSKEREFNPDYATDDIAALAIFFAEFRSDIDQSFNNASFISLLKRVVQEGTPALKTRIVWLFWKVCEEKKENFKKLEKYLPLLFKPPFHSSIVSQVDFLIENILDTYPSEALTLFDSIINYIKIGLDERSDEIQRVFLAYSEKILPEVLKIAPEKFASYLSTLYTLWERGVYIGNPKEILSLYEQAPGKYRGEIKTVSEKILGQMKVRAPQLFE